ncbi:hypothetical protein BN971_01875 [Mycobacterium bohemicum DSM 44277]|uniref:Uncharacterized protein n=1 Tax=Mycobacterium bohemicum DSM 44277 TaxID=1236609 RepID=A0A0U0W855_MYCBE|nr:protein DpdG [Mycobacterium bohemicum]MCV6970084.1 hypothetical protein [Mycobacterium bohemicum]CPR10481.1 hypothetical protein BN971_01875 [Mycobacterium bohemicum DSM 44277]
MALLNPPEIRPSGIVLITRYLACQRGQQDTVERLGATLAPASLPGDPQSDVTANLRAGTELGLFSRDDDKVRLADGVLTAVEGEAGALITLLRRRVFDDSVNNAPWPSQVGARDLTSALSWFLTFAAGEAPIRQEAGPRSAETLQLADFGPRQQEGESSNWPIGNSTRWNGFRRWACTLGFAWANPKGHLIPDPTVAVRDALPDVFGGANELTAQEFVKHLAQHLPILDGGRYREFVADNWKRPPSENRGLTAPLSDALERLSSEKSIVLDDRADAARVAKADGSTFSHARIGASE